MDFDHPPSNPIDQFHAWLAEAEAQTNLPNPNAMTLATVDENGTPSARIVLLKGLDDRGAVFYTNRNSRKGKELDANAVASLLFHWDTLHRQIRIDGGVSPVSDDESDTYFATRERLSQIAAWASDQSEPIDSRTSLEARFIKFVLKFEDQDVPRPPFWGGYRVSLGRIEFWQGRDRRFHDRVVYSPDGHGGWTSQRLSP